MDTREELKAAETRVKDRLSVPFVKAVNQFPVKEVLSLYVKPAYVWGHPKVPGLESLVNHVKPSMDGTGRLHPGRPIEIMPTHESMLDPFLLANVLLSKGVYVRIAAGSLWMNGLLRPLMKLCGCIKTNPPGKGVNDKHESEVFPSVLEERLLSMYELQSIPLVVFPQATRRTSILQINPKVALAQVYLAAQMQLRDEELWLWPASVHFERPPDELSLGIRGLRPRPHGYIRRSYLPFLTQAFKWSNVHVAFGEPLELVSELEDRFNMKDGRLRHVELRMARQFIMDEILNRQLSVSVLFDNELVALLIQHHAGGRLQQGQYLSLNVKRAADITNRWLSNTNPSTLYGTLKPPITSDEVARLFTPRNLHRVATLKKYKAGKLEIEVDSGIGNYRASHAAQVIEYWQE